MTINGIWEWANHVAQRVSLEALRGKVLSIDGHIWLYESLKGCETHHQQTPNSYLITFFTRIQRLREMKITPVVVFDSITTTSAAHEECDQDEFVPRKRHSLGNDSPFTNLADPVIKTNALLSHLGVKVIISPGDGEAQCARLEELGVTSGCITTDFDYFLFGGKNLYRFDFTSSATSAAARLHDIMHLSLGKMNIEKKVSRPHLISTAIMLGCDYFQRGVQNIGLITVFDILAEFGDEGSEEIDPHVILDRFSSYVREEIPARSEDTPRKLRLRRKKYNFHGGFPNCDAVHYAIKKYLHPSVSNERPILPSPSSANIKKVEETLVRECGWTQERMQREMMTSVRRSRNITNTVNQTKVSQFFATTKHPFSPIVEPCSSLDEYISANNNYMRKRKRSEEQKESPSTSEQPNKRKMYPVSVRRRTFRIDTPPIQSSSTPVRRPSYSGGVIELGDSD